MSKYASPQLTSMFIEGLDSLIKPPLDAKDTSKAQMLITGMNFIPLIVGGHAFSSLLSKSPSALRLQIPSLIRSGEPASYIAAELAQLLGEVGLYDPEEVEHPFELLNAGAVASHCISSISDAEQAETLHFIRDITNKLNDLLAKPSLSRILIRLKQHDLGNYVVQNHGDLFRRENTMHIMISLILALYDTMIRRLQSIRAKDRIATLNGELLSINDMGFTSGAEYFQTLEHEIINVSNHYHERLQRGSQFIELTNYDYYAAIASGGVAKPSDLATARNYQIKGSMSVLREQLSDLLISILTPLIKFL